MLLLDEPFNGLDPAGIAWMRDLLRDLAAEGRSVLVSSHLMSELQGMAGHVVVVGQGRVIVAADVDDLVGEYASLETAYLRLTAGVGGIR